MKLKIQKILIETDKALFVSVSSDLGFWIPRIFYKSGGYVSVPDDFEIKLREFEIDREKSRYYGNLSVKVSKEDEFKPIKLTPEKAELINDIRSAENDILKTQKEIDDKNGVFKSRDEADSLYKGLKDKEQELSDLEKALKSEKKPKPKPAPKTAKEIKTPIAIEKQFEKELVKFSEKVNNSVKFWSIANFNKNFNKNTAKQLSIEFNKLLEYWESEAKTFGEIQSKKLAGFIKKYVNSKFLSENPEFNKRGLSKPEKNQLTAIYERNLSLIKTIPIRTIESYKEAFLNQIDNFDREALEKQAKTISGISKRRAKLIARDQTQKAVSGYQRARAEALGFEYYVWQTSKDERVSKGKGGHRQLDGRIYKYSNPTAIIDIYGNKGNVSERPNCRCVALSLYLRQDEELKLIKDSENGDYYKIVKKML